MSATLKTRSIGVFVGCALLVSSLALAGCSGDSGPAEPEDLPLQTREVSVYFSSGRTLTEERRVVDATTVYEATLLELLEAEPENTEMAIVQPVAEMKSVTFENGLVTIDWDPAILDFRADAGEYELAWAAFLLTLGQFDEVTEMSFTVDGKTSGEVGGKDIAEFWGSITLEDQPWKVQRPPKLQESDEDTGSAEATTTE